MDDFFQTEVDEFHNGLFLFLSAKEVNIKVDRDVLEKIENYESKGWIVSTYCYTAKLYYKILVCDYQPKPWQNHYHIEAVLSESNGCYGYAIKSSIEEFIEWMQITDN